MTKIITKWHVWCLSIYSISDHWGLNTGKQLWLGVTDVAQEGVYVWDENGKQLTYYDWDGGQPNNLGGNQDYVNYRFGYGWHDAEYDRTHGAICQYNTSRYSR